MVTLSSHIYTTIFRTEVRLLKLLPNVSRADNAAGECDIYFVSLSTRPQYEALSHVWGDQANEKDTIWIAGTEFEVIKNLLRDSVRTSWIGQICINQDDPEEKSICEYMALLSEVDDAKVVPVPTFVASLDHFKLAMRALRSIHNSENLWTRIWTVQEAVLPPNLCLV
ncbi:hypothetical protein BHYA_0486g00030 [Botrytis hyacinthi]|uniref:Heterokaryon incompatibility domain-containing protein n=1 Tax=Botrytis hyacinthi TaxID=278943 RepID=A0A4Z1G826_9HELO|nr:hypothetical protein BHYA_0486g00030 [Botrytis hyacinthi]